jgi:uncharacterized protein YgiM (DUF1202 family)
MGKFMIATFLLLGWSFYELSGGSEFEPQSWPVAAATNDATISIPAEAVVSRRDTMPLSLTPGVTQISLDTSDAAQNAGVIETPVVNASLTSADADALVVDAVLTSSPTMNLHSVSGDRVNMRVGPGTTYGVVSTLPKGTEAEILDITDDGWARIRLLQSGQIGWMAERLLAPL